MFSLGFNFFRSYFCWSLFHSLWSLDLTFFFYILHLPWPTYHQMFNFLGFRSISSIFFPIYSVFSQIFIFLDPHIIHYFFHDLQIIRCLIFTTTTSIFQILNIFRPYSPLAFRIVSKWKLINWPEKISTTFSYTFWPRRRLDPKKMIAEGDEELRIIYSQLA
jgi:hypothetical protein